MKDVFPADAVRAKFTVPVVIDQFDLTKIYEVADYFGGDLCNLALNVWNRIIQIEKRPLDPSAMSRFHNPRTGEWNVAMVTEIGRLLGEPLLKDLAFTHCRIEDDSLEDNTVSRLFLGRVYPNDVHIADICFQDPRQPIPEKQRRYQFQTHKGLCLLDEAMARIEAYARSQKCIFITLTAASEDHVPLFGKYGFTVEDNEPGKMQRAMEKKLT